MSLRKHVGLVRAGETRAEFDSQAVDSGVLENAKHRLGVIGMAFAGLAGFALVLNLVTVLGLGWQAPDNQILRRVIVTVFLGLALAMVVLAKSERPAREVLLWGRGFQVTGGVLMAVLAYGMIPVIDTNIQQMTWLAVWILMWPLLLPARPRDNLIASFVVASCAPLVFFVWVAATGAQVPPVSSLVNSFIPYYLCAGLAVVPASVVYRLGQRVAEVRQEAKELGSYRLVQKLGEGGMGAVWRAEHHALARSAAVKLIKPELLNENPAAAAETLSRFEREAQTTASLRSPHTIDLYDFGVSEDGTIYYAMEMLEGIDLDALVRDNGGPIPPGRVVHLLRQACDSLAEAHGRGMIHRDIKPANVFLCRLGRTCDFVKVLDFGLVKTSKREADPQLTGEGFIVGTPAFMPPEQAMGKQVEARSDLYALGCIGYWLLTGKMVFESESTMHMLISHAKDPPRPPSSVTDAEIPEDLEQVILDCLAKEPDARPLDAEELSARLAACQVEPWTQADARRWWTERGPGRKGLAGNPVTAELVADGSDVDVVAPTEFHPPPSTGV